MNKYHEGKVQSTLERELNVPELVACQEAGFANSKNIAYTQLILLPVFMLKFFTLSNNCTGNQLQLHAIPTRCS